MTYNEIYNLRNSCIREEELEEIRFLNCCYKAERSRASPYLSMEYYKITFWEDDKIGVAVMRRDD